MLFVYIELLAVVVMWSHAPVLIKFCLRSVGPWDLVVIRHIPAALAFALVLAFEASRDSHVRGTIRTMLRADWWRLTLVGLFAVAGYHFALNTGTQHIPAGTAAIIVGMVPVFTFIVASATMGERPTVGRAIGIAVAFAGVYVCVRYGGGKAVELTHVTGALITLIAPVFAALYITFSRPLVRRHSALHATAAAIMLGTVPLLATIRPELIRALPELSMSFWAALLFLSLGCTAFAYVLWAHALRRLDATNVAASLYVIPLLGVVWGNVYLDETITRWIVAGAVMIVAGVAITNRNARA